MVMSQDQNSGQNHNTKINPLKGWNVSYILEQL